VQPLPAKSTQSNSSIATATEGESVSQHLVKKRRISTSSTLTATSLISGTHYRRQVIFKTPAMRKEPRYFGDCASEVVRTPRSAKRNWQLAKQNIIALRKRVKNIQQQNRRLRSRVVCFKSLLAYLKERQLITDNAEPTINVSM
jgi:hypothetical protein